MANTPFAEGYARIAGPAGAQILVESDMRTPLVDVIVSSRIGAVGDPGARLGFRTLPPRSQNAAPVASGELKLMPSWPSSAVTSTLRLSKTKYIFLGKSSRKTSMAS